MIDILAPYIAFVTVTIVVLYGSTPLIIFLGYLGVIVFAVWNSGYRQGTTGQSIGRLVTKTKLVKIETGEPIGFGMTLLRQICIVMPLGIFLVIPFGFVIPIGIGFLIGLPNYLWSLWDPKRQTVADKIANAVVVRIDDATT